MGSSYMQMDLISADDFEELDYLFHVFLVDRKIWLFGTGEYAKSFFRFLHECEVQVEGFVVSDRKNNPLVFMGKKVIDAEQFRELYCSGGYRTGLILTVSSAYYGEIFPFMMYMKDDLYMPKEIYKRFAKEHCGTVSNIELSFPLVDFCKGISCYGCTAGAPIAERRIYEVFQFQHDISKMHSLLGDRITRINFTGGDVFLHPELAKLTEMARGYYPDAEISFSINGIGMDKQSDELWRRLGKCGVKMVWTLYPVDYPDYADVMKKIKEIAGDGISFAVQGDSAGDTKTSWRMPFDMYNKSEGVSP